MKKSALRLLSVVLAVLILCSTMLVGTVISANAVTLESGDTIYLNPGNDWTVDGARFAIYFWGSGDTWASMSKNSNGIYEAKVPAGSWTNLLFVRLNGSTTDNNWDNKWNQTVDLTWDGTNNCFNITDPWSSSNEGKALGNWSYVDDGGVVTQPSSLTSPTKPTTIPTTAPEPTEAPEPDEDQFLYVSARTNIGDAKVKTKTQGDLITVSYMLTADELIDGGQATITYDTTKIALSGTYNTPENMFPVLKDTAYNLSSGKGEAMFNFSGLNNDFTQGAVFVNLVFERRNSAVGTAIVRLNVSELASKNTTYIEDNVVYKAEGITMAPVVTESEPSEPSSSAPVATDATQDIKVNVSSNIQSEAVDVQVNKRNVKVVFNLTAPEALAYGNGTVAFDESLLALEEKYNTASSMFTTISSGTTHNLNAASGTMMFTFAGVDAANNKGLFDFSKGGELLTLVFTVKSGAQGTAHIRLNVENMGTFNADYVADYVPAEGIKATITATALEANAPTPSDPSNPTNPTNPTDPTDSTPQPTESQPTPTESQPTSTETQPATKPTVKPATSAGAGVSEEAVDGYITKKLTKDQDAKGSKYAALQLKPKKVAKNTITIKWNKVNNAKKYVIYGNKCGNAYKYKKIKTVTGTSFTQKNLKKGTYYKYLVVAINAKGKTVTTSKTIHVATLGNKKKSNPTGITTAAKNNKVSVKVKKTFKLKGKAVIKKGTKVSIHRVVKYETTNTKVATVSSKGVITAKKKGVCYVYAYAQNGMAKKIKVTVKK